MVRFLVLVLVNIVVVGLVAMQAVPPLLAGCDIGGSCANGPGVMTWGLGVGLPLLSLIGLAFAARSMLGKGRAKTDGKRETIALAGDAVAAPVAATKQRKSLFRSRTSAAEPTGEEVGSSEQAADASAQSRLSRVRATAEAEVEAANQPDADFPVYDDAPLSTDAATPPVDGATAPDAPVDTGDSEPQPVVPETQSFDEADDLPLSSPGSDRLRVIPFSMADEEDGIVAEDDGLDWLFENQHIASPDDTGFPWIVATIDRFCEAMIDDRAMLLSETIRGEAQAWRTAVAPLPRHELITGRDAHDFTGWANQCLSMSGGAARMLVVDVMQRLREEARHDPRVEQQLPVALLDQDGRSPRAISA